MENNKVIEMADRRKKSQSAGLKLRLDAEQMKVLTTTSLISILFLVGLANNTLFSGASPASEQVATIHEESVHQAERMIASVSAPAREWEQSVVNKLSGTETRANTRVGKRPGPLENLLLGALEGKYSAKLKDGKLQELQFTTDAESNSPPAPIGDRAAFLGAISELVPMQFSKVAKIAVDAADGRTETYNLIEGTKTLVGQVSFRLDEAGRLLWMKVQPGVAKN